MVYTAVELYASISYIFYFYKLLFIQDSFKKESNYNKLLLGSGLRSAFTFTVYKQLKYVVFLAVNS